MQIEHDIDGFSELLESLHVILGACTCIVIMYFVLVFYSLRSCSVSRFNSFPNAHCLS